MGEAAKRRRCWGWFKALDSFGAAVRRAEQDEARPGLFPMAPGEASAVYRSIMRIPNAPPRFWKRVVDQG